ncbi:terminase [Stenotrophomonas maltophilia]|uniref:phage terminase large subunit n=1 Tax=Stenotrophomonas maltophilia TaxID=40324 RepID=UPI000DA7B818|nr:phage terminase large subunit [Stenotrophomonas maltophilia]PZT35134.1 terminase [Stenotrophomonas maltophilia]HEL5052571.1 phage terminase large subunit [Stenotrophomonas maltophilia]
MLRPQKGPQERFLATAADIAIYGGAAGGGKTFGLLLETMRHTAVEGFSAVIFRRNGTQITAPGGLWTESVKLYPLLGAEPRTSPHAQWTFPSGAQVQMRHLQYDADVLGWQGSQIPLICFDELTHFTRAQFFYMLSRNRSTSGVRPYVRATCNPDADSWVADFIAWWIDQETGLPIPERDGVVRYFTVVNDSVVWGYTPGEVVASAGLKSVAGLPPEALVKSATFIAASVYDNKALLEANPEYLANLMALSRVERERLLGGNWKVRRTAGSYFRRTDVDIIPTRPSDVLVWVRKWDLAATEPSEANPDPDWTAGVLMGKRRDGRFVVADVVRARIRAAEVRKLIQNTAKLDGKRVRVVVPQDPGQAGKDQAENMVGQLAGQIVSATRETGDKETRAEPFAAQWQVGNVDVVEGPWNRDYFAELEAFPTKQAGIHDDQVDASAGAFAELQSDKLARFMAMAQ